MRAKDLQKILPVGVSDNKLQLNNVVEFVYDLPIIIYLLVGSKAPHEILPTRTLETFSEKALEKLFQAVAAVREWEMQNTSRALPRRTLLHVSAHKELWSSSRTTTTTTVHATATATTHCGMCRTSSCSSPNSPYGICDRAC
jgi:hypothetical protein